MRSRLQQRISLLGKDEGGFTLMETVVSIMILGIVMTASTAFFITANHSTSNLRHRSAAVQLADDALEQAHSMNAARLWESRDQSSEVVQWNAAHQPAGAGNPWSAVGAWLANTKEVSDLNAAPGTGTRCVRVGSGGAAGPVCIPTVATAPVLDGITYLVNTFVGQCWAPKGALSSTCTQVETATAVPFYRVVAAVSWQGSSCPLGGCIYISAVLFNSTGSDPIFNVNQPGAPTPAPQIQSPGPQFDDIGTFTTLRLSGTGGSGTFGWTATGLPPGLSLPAGSNTIVGSFTGSITTSQAYSVTLKATDSANTNAQPVSFVWTVSPPPAIESPATGSTQTVVTGSTLAVTVTVRNGTGSAPFAYSTTTNPLPAGVSLTGNVLRVAATAAIGSYPINLTVTDKDSLTATSNITLKVVAPVSVTAVSNQASTASQAITPLAMTATGGISPNTWSMAGAPPGLAINATTGSITGTPTTVGTYSVTVRATDSSGGVSTTGFSWTISAGFSLAANSNLTSWPTDPVSQQLVSSGAVGQIAWSATGLPGGLTLNATTGVVAGTPTTVGGYPVTLSATDAAGRSATRSFTWTIKLRSGQILDSAGLCVDDYNVSTTPGNPVGTYTCNNQSNQTWTLQTDHTIRVTVGTTTMCLSASGSTPGSSVVIAVCDATQLAQQWIPTTNGSALNLVNRRGSLCLDEPSAGPAALDMATCDADAHRSWRLPT